MLYMRFSLLAITMHHVSCNKFVLHFSVELLKNAQLGRDIPSFCILNEKSLFLGHLRLKYVSESLQALRYSDDANKVQVVLYVFVGIVEHM